MTASVQSWDGVVVLGKELRRDRARALRELGARAAAAAVALRQGATAVATLEAPLSGQEEAGSAIVARALDELGVPTEHVIVAQITRSTREEAVESRYLAQAQGWRRIGVITSRYHLQRSQRIFDEVMGVGSAEVCEPIAFVSGASVNERALILRGEPSAGAMKAEASAEAILSGLAKTLRPLPRRAAWGIECWAGVLWRGIHR